MDQSVNKLQALSTVLAEWKVENTTRQQRKASRVDEIYGAVFKACHKTLLPIGFQPDGLVDR
jgi:hypothetical protein